MSGTTSLEKNKFQPLISANMPGKPVTYVILFLEFWVTLVLMYWINAGYYSRIFVGRVWTYLLLPLFLYGLVWQFFIISTIITSLVYFILTRIEPPKEGLFELSSREAQFYFIRFWICFYSLYIARAMPLPWVDMYVFPIFGSHIGKNIVLYDSWIDPEFVDINDNCMISLNTQLISHAIIGNKLFVKKVIIKKSGIAGAGAVIAPGTIVKEGAVLGGACSTSFDQELAPYCIHVGSPVNIAIPIKIKKTESKIPTDKHSQHTETHESNKETKS
ncbi:MAG: acyltransferase [Promethearchaeota archaeon]